MFYAEWLNEMTPAPTPSRVPLVGIEVVLSESLSEDFFNIFIFMCDFLYHSNILYSYLIYRGLESNNVICVTPLMKIHGDEGSVFK